MSTRRMVDSMAAIWRDWRRERTPPAAAVRCNRSRPAVRLASPSLAWKGVVGQPAGADSEWPSSQSGPLRQRFCQPYYRPFGGVERLIRTGIGSA
jgi:hypothetical protein